VNLPLYFKFPKPISTQQCVTNSVFKVSVGIRNDTRHLQQENNTTGHKFNTNIKPTPEHSWHRFTASGGNM
jgi:hypothetical protein